MRLETDVAVIGAGPAGCAAATVLARGGARVTLCDRARFPREKICGGGLLPDALASLEELGVGDAVRRTARPVKAIRYRASPGSEVRIALSAAVTVRRDLDALLLDAAVAAGAEPLLGASFEGVADTSSTTVKVLLGTSAGRIEVEASACVLATGAARRARELAGLRGGARSGAALRGYAEVPDLLDDEMLIVLTQELPGGYAWAFPVQPGVWNVGCGIFSGSRRRVDLGDAANQFLRAIGGKGWLTEPQGAALLTAFPRLETARGRVVAVGDAAGLTRPLSGDGIGPALASGTLAGRCLVGRRGPEAIAEYTRRLAGLFAADHRAWRFGERLLAMPRVLELLISGCRVNPETRLRIAGLLSGTVQARRVLSPSGLIRVALGL